MTVKEVSHPGDANATDELRDQLRSGAIQSFKTGEALPAQGRLADLGGAHDRLQARSRRPLRVRHLGRRGHLLAQGRRGAHPVPRDARRSHRLAESRDVHAAAGAVDRDGAALRPQARGAVHRPRPLQGHQRHVRPRGRRRAAARDGRAACASACAPATSWHASAATSSSCCCRRSPIPAQAAAVARNISDRRDEARRHPRPGVPRHGQHRHLLASRGRAGRSVDHEERRHGDVSREGGGQEQLPVLHEPHEAAFDRAAGARDESAPRARAQRVLAALPGEGELQVGRDHGRRGAAALAEPASSAPCRRRSSSRSPRRRASSCRSASGCCARRARKASRG